MTRTPGVGERLSRHLLGALSRSIPMICRLRAQVSRVMPRALITRGPANIEPHVVTIGPALIVRNCEAFWFFTPLPKLPHRAIRCLDVPPKSIGVEQRMG